MITFFLVTNVIIALVYGLIAVMFAIHTRLPVGNWKKGWRVLVAGVFLSLFFFGCVHTHLELAYLSYLGELNPHWLAWHTMISHGLQAVGGVVFYVLTRKWIRFSIYDKVDYQRVVEVVDEEIMKKIR